MTEIQGHYVEPTSGLAFLHRAWKRLSRQRPRAVPDDALTSDDERLRPQDHAGDKAFEVDGDGRSHILPIPDLATCKQLLGYYHDLCVATYRFLHRPSVESWLEQAHLNMDSGLPIGHGIGEMKAAIVLCVLAVAMFHKGKSSSTGVVNDKSGSNEAISTRKSDRLFLAATRVADGATGYPTIDSVQARLVQVLYLLHTSRLNQAWYVFGHALQIISALGLHRRASRGRSLTGAKAGPQDYIEAQCKKRAFWVAYILDSYLGIMFGRPRHFHDENIDQELPDAVNDEDMAPDGPYVRDGPQDCAIESLIFHARIGRIVGRISQSVYAINQDLGDSLVQVVHDIRTDIESWTASLPAILCSVNPTSLVYPFRRQAITMRLARDHAIMHLNRPFLLRQIGSHSEQQAIAIRAVADCISAAREVLGIVDRMAQDGTLFYAFWWTHYVAFCSLTVVYVWEIQRHGPGWGPQLELDADLIHDTQTGETRLQDQDDGLFQLAEQCRQHLAKATALNSPSRRYSIILEELRQEAHYKSAARSDLETIQAAQSLQSVHSSIPLDSEGLLTGGRNRQQPLENVAEAGRLGRSLQPTPGYDSALVAPLQGGTAAFSVLQSPWDGWQTIDWMDIDALALDPFSGFATSPDSWVPGSLPLSVFGQ